MATRMQMQKAAELYGQGYRGVPPRPDTKGDMVCGGPFRMVNSKNEIVQINPDGSVEEVKDGPERGTEGQGSPSGEDPEGPVGERGSDPGSPYTPAERGDRGPGGLEWVQYLELKLELKKTIAQEIRGLTETISVGSFFMGFGLGMVITVLSFIIWRVIAGPLGF